MVSLLGRSRKSRPEAVGMVLFGSQSRRFCRGFSSEAGNLHRSSQLWKRSQTLLSLTLFAAQQPEGQRSRETILPTWTDNRGNGSVTKQVDDNTVPLVHPRRGACCRDEEEQCPGSGRMDAEGVQQ